MKSEKIKTFLVEFEGELILTENLSDTLEYLTGGSDITAIEPIDGENETVLTITIQRKYTEEDLINMPEHQ